MALMGVTDAAAPLTVKQRGTESLCFVPRHKLLGLLTDKLLVFNLCGAAANLVSSLLLGHDKTSFVPYDIQSPALIRMLSILWAQGSCRA